MKKNLRNARAGDVIRRLAFLFLCIFILTPALSACGQRTERSDAGEGASLSVETIEETPPEEEPEEEPEQAPEPVELTPEERLEADIAAGQISWENAPVIGDRDALMAYMRRVRDARIAEAPVIYAAGYMADYEEILKAVNLAYIDFEIRSEEEGSRHVLYTLTYYPGERVADAYHQGNTDGLTEEEKILYESSIPLIEAAKELPSDLHRELFLHDQIIGRATYHNREERVGVPRFCTAVGALIDGQANCQGYADAFYMLASMAGFTVSKQSGYAADKEHIWNTILSNGQWYAVDCTYDDASYKLKGTEYTSYTYFNAPAEILDVTHRVDDYTVEHPIVQDLADAPDYFYRTKEADDQFFGHTFDSMDGLIKDAAERLARGARYVYSMAPQDEQYRKYRDVTKVVDRELLGFGKSSNYLLILNNRDEYSFVTIDATGTQAEQGEETQSGNAAENAASEAEEEENRPDEDGVFTSAEDVALYLHVYGRLPKNFMTKKEARALGWQGGGLERYAPGMSIGGDVFGNYEGLLPEDKRYHECDIDTMGADSRGSKRIVYADDGSIYYTEDHYASYRQLY